MYGGGGQIYLWFWIDIIHISYGVFSECHSCLPCGEMRCDLIHIFVQVDLFIIQTLYFVLFFCIHCMRICICITDDFLWVSFLSPLWWGGGRKWQTAKLMDSSLLYHPHCHCHHHEYDEIDDHDDDPEYDHPDHAHGRGKCVPSLPLSVQISLLIRSWLTYSASPTLTVISDCGSLYLSFVYSWMVYFCMTWYL